MLNHSLLHFFTDASPVVKAVMALLLVASLISWTLIIQRGSLLGGVSKRSKQFMKRFRAGESLDSLYRESHSSRNSLNGTQTLFSTGFAEFLRLKQRRVDNAILMEGVIRGMNAAQAKQMAIMEGNLSFLATIGSISPYVGLFGTVWGIMTSFQALGAVQQATIAMVAPGISEALIATAMGLFAAIPAVIAYNRFVYRIDVIANEFDIFQNELLNLLTRQIYLVPSPAAQTPTDMGMVHEI